MISNSLKHETSRFLTGLIGTLLVSFVIGWPAIGVIAYLCGYVAWLLLRMDAMVRWLGTGAKPAHAPPTVGMTDEMVQLIHREKKYSRKQKSRYRRTLAQFNSLAADLPDATVVLNEEYEIRWANSAARKLLNIHPERDRGQRIDNLVRIPEFREFLYAPTAEKKASAARSLDDPRLAKPSVDSVEEMEIPGPAGDGRTLAVRKVRTGKHMTVLIAADITQRVQVREMRKAFVGDVSHELRTPLTVVRGYLEMLQEDKSLGREVSNALEHISAQADRMQGIVEDLLQLSRLEGDPLPDYEGETLCVGNMIRAMIGPLNKVAGKHEFILDLDDSLSLLGSEQEIYSAFNNLLANAVRYTEAGTTIRVSWQAQADGSALYSVIDNGPGIESRHLPRLSERFYRVDTGRSRDDGGTGLGLAIVKHAAQRHGGSLEIQSSPGMGSQFDLRFPPGRVVTLQQVANQ